MGVHVCTHDDGRQVCEHHIHILNVAVLSFSVGSYAKGRDYDPDRERAERKKLQRAVKKEARGAARELRKDNYFLAEEKRKEQVEAEGEREEKYKKAMAFLQEQEGAFKSGQLGNSAKKKKRK